MIGVGEHHGQYRFELGKRQSRTRALDDNALAASGVNLAETRAQATTVRIAALPI
jgi:hypothetical protein